MESTDLALLAAALPAFGITVARFEQPWRLAGRPVAGPAAELDDAWREALGSVVSASVPHVVGGRSAGARVAARTLGATRAAGVLALAYPLHPPGRPDRSRAAEVPHGDVLVVQGDRDRLGTAAEVRDALRGRPDVEVVRVAGADHALRVARRGPVTQGEADELVLIAVRRWLVRVLGNLRAAPRR